VVWNMNFMTFHSVGNVIIPADELIFVRGVGIPPTSNRFPTFFSLVYRLTSWCDIVAQKRARWCHTIKPF